MFPPKRSSGCITKRNPRQIEGGSVDALSRMGGETVSLCQCVGGSAPGFLNLHCLHSLAVQLHEAKHG